MVYVFLISAIILTFEVHAAGVVPIGNCPAGVDFEKSGYIIRSARVETPFQYLSWLRTAIKNLGSNSADLAGRPYENSEVRRRADELEKLNFLPGLIEQQVRVSLVVTSVENCSGSELDLVYSVFTTQIAPVLSRTFESYQSEKFAPERAAGYRRGNKSLALFSVGCL